MHHHASRSSRHPSAERAIINLMQEWRPQPPRNSPELRRDFAIRAQKPHRGRPPLRYRPDAPDRPIAAFSGRARSPHARGLRSRRNDSRPGPAAPPMNFIAAVQTLVDGVVELVIVGGWPAILHGSSRLTNGLDLCFSRKAGNLRSLARAWRRSIPGYGTCHGICPSHGTMPRCATEPFSRSPRTSAHRPAGRNPRVRHCDEVKASSILVPAFDRDCQDTRSAGPDPGQARCGPPKDLLILPELESVLEAQGPE